MYAHVGMLVFTHIMLVCTSRHLQGGLLYIKITYAPMIYILTINKIIVEDATLEGLCEFTYSLLHRFFPVGLTFPAWSRLPGRGEYSNDQKHARSPGFYGFLFNVLTISEYIVAFVIRELYSSKTKYLGGLFHTEDHRQNRTDLFVRDKIRFRGAIH